MCEILGIQNAGLNGLNPLSGQQQHYTDAHERFRRSKDAGTELARLMERQLGYVEGHIDNIALRLFIRAHWSKVSALAHAIHAE